MGADIVASQHKSGYAWSEDLKTGSNTVRGGERWVTVPAEKGVRRSSISVAERFRLQLFEHFP
jgi:hypothetical protein